MSGPIPICPCLERERATSKVMLRRRLRPLSSSFAKAFSIPCVLIRLAKCGLLSFFEVCSLSIFWSIKEKGENSKLQSINRIQCRTSTPNLSFKFQRFSPGETLHRCLENWMTHQISSATCNLPGQITRAEPLKLNNRPHLRRITQQS